MSKRVLITGAAGFVGANLARRLLRDGHEVHLLLRGAHTAWRLAPLRKDVARHAADLEDRTAVAQAVARARPDWVFHLAAHGAYSWERDARRIVATNVVGTANLIDACLRTGVDVLVNTGSSSEYGRKDHAPSEDDALEPNSHYAAAKASATLLCRCTARSRKVRIPTLRLYSVYGPYEEPNRLIPALIVYGLDGRLPPLTHPDTGRDFVYVDDVIEAYLSTAAHGSADPGAVYNIGSGIQTPLRALVELAQRSFAITSTPVWGTMPDRSWDTDVWFADPRKIAAELGWRPAHTLADGFARTIEWLRADEKLARFYAHRLEKITTAGTGAHREGG